MLRHHLEKLHYFRVICDCGSLRKAAEQLRISQSALSIALKRLEEVLEQELLIRTARGIQLTATGQMLHQFSADIGRQVEEIELRLRNPSDPFAGKIRIGSYESIANYWLPQFVRATRESFPNLHFEISIGSSLEICQQVSDGSIDIGIAIQAPKTEAYRSIKLFDDSFSFYMQKSKNRRSSAKNHHRMPFIGMWNARINKRKQLSDLMNELGIAMTHSITVQSFEIARSLAAQGLGISVLPERVAEVQVSSREIIRVKHLPQKFGSHDVHMLYGAEDLRHSQLVSQLIAVASGLC